MRCKELINNNSTITLPSKIKKVLSDKKKDWLLKAEFDNAIIELRGDKVIWHMGTWHRGHWHGDKWMDGIWHNGFWHQGEWQNGTWYNGTWIDGIWHNGVWKKGNWKGGEKRKTYSL